MARRQRRDLSVFESSCHLPTCLPHTAEASHCPFNCWTSSREAVNTNFYSLWFDPTGNRTRVYRFSSRRSIHSTTDRLITITKYLIILVQPHHDHVACVDDERVRRCESCTCLVACVERIFNPTCVYCNTGEVIFYIHVLPVVTHISSPIHPFFGSEPVRRKMVPVEDCRNSNQL